jgi:hypothetical protein
VLALALALGLSQAARASSSGPGADEPPQPCRLRFISMRPKPPGRIMRRMDMNKALEELPVLREFIDFVNRQVEVYSDCLSGFQGNKVRIERQVARVTHPTYRKIEDGQPVMVWTSVEDPTRPDIIHQRIVRADEFINLNSEAAFNEQQICWAIIVFIFQYWKGNVRQKNCRYPRS